jgi:hypothetical protein
MDSIEAGFALAKEFGVREEDARKAIDLEAADIRENGKLIRYAKSVELATDRVRSWLKDGDEYAVKLNWLDLASFVSSHRPACVWAVLVAKDRFASQMAEGSGQ